MLTLISAKLATVEELFIFKQSGFKLKEFPGYTDDQWGIKAHNRPWIEKVGDFKSGQNIIEVDGAYSTLPEYLARKYQLNAWIGDDFGMKSGDKLWSRWGDPAEYAEKNKEVKYVFEPFGIFSKEYPAGYFDRIFSISTLEHITSDKILDVFKDMNRCTKKGGMQIHTIDLGTHFKHCLMNTIFDTVPFADVFIPWAISETKRWKGVLRKSGIKVMVKLPHPLSLLNRSILVESPDVVYRFYPQNNSPKPYSPAASLLLIIKDL